MLRHDLPDEERIGARDLAHWSTSFGRWLAHHVVRLAHWTGANAVLVLTAVVGLAIALVMTVAFEQVYESVVERDDLASLDRPVLDLMVSWRGAGLDSVVTAFTNLGGTVGMPVLAVLAVALMTWRWRSRTPITLMLIAAAGSLAMTAIGKDLTGRIRPPQNLAVPPYETSPSFPSGHTLNATVVTGIVVYLVLHHLHSARARTAAIVAGVVFAATIGLSRVFLGHHWLTDVIGAWLLGLGWLAAVITAHRLYLTARRSGAPAGPVRRVDTPTEPEG